MVVFGGYVRLSRSGLSIVEWDVVTGIVPPLDEEAWQASFTQYQQTPEFQKVNREMTLAAYQRIFYVEYIHRLIARIAGLIVVVPLFIFLLNGRIPWRRSGIYLLIALLFGFQGALGWYMVSSGLVDRPSVSPYRLTAHLLTALLVLAIAFWQALDHIFQDRAGSGRSRRTAPRVWAILLLAVLVVQIAYGGLVAGLKAGHVSDTFPLMFGYLVPPGIFATLQPWWANLIANATALHFLHRWFAFAVLLVAIVLFLQTGNVDYSGAIRRGRFALMVLVLLQIALGISVVWWHVPLVLALLHQLSAVLLFLAVLFLNHRLRVA